jgi:hypothetical protein
LALVSDYKVLQPNNNKLQLIIPDLTTNTGKNLVGKIYKKGVQLGLRAKLNHLTNIYSYNLDTITVGRDRDCVNNVYEQY